MRSTSAIPERSRRLASCSLAARAARSRTTTTDHTCQVAATVDRASLRPSQTPWRSAVAGLGSVVVVTATAAQHMPGASAVEGLAWRAELRLLQSELSLTAGNLARISTPLEKGDLMRTAKALRGTARTWVPNDSLWSPRPRTPQTRSCPGSGPFRLVNRGTTSEPLASSARQWYCLLGVRR